MNEPPLCLELVSVMRCRKRAGKTVLSCNAICCWVHLARIVTSHVDVELLAAGQEKLQYSVSDNDDYGTVSCCGLVLNLFLCLLLLLVSCRVSLMLSEAMC